MKKFLSILFAAMFFATLSFPSIATTDDAVTGGTQNTDAKCPPLC